MSLGDKPKAERRPDRAALVIAIVLVLAGLGIFFSTWLMQLGAMAANAPVGPKAVPYIIAGAFVVLGALTVVSAWRDEFPERERQDFPPMLWIVGGLAVQLLTMKSVGFSIATGLLFAATAKGFGKGPLWKTIPIGIAFCFMVWLLFAKGLQLTLPVGTIWEKLLAGTS